METFMAKFSSETREMLSKRYCCIWECDDTVDECRDCGSPFTFFWRQHHCRSCGGIYCDGCCPGGHNRICLFCMRGLMPGNHIFHYHTETRDSLSSRYFKSSHIFDRTTFIPLPQLKYGSLYDDNFVMLDANSIPHKSGYFQFSNRTDSMCAVKVVAEGSNVYNEIFRPPYLSVLPRESVYTDIEGLASIYVIILYANPHPLIEGEKVVYESMRGDKVSPECQVKLFAKYTMYKIRSIHKNVLVKCKEDGGLEPRSGTSRRLKHKAAGFFSGVLSSSSRSVDSDPVRSELDLSTNIEHIAEILV